jgi:class 3 adenylate cyclase
MREEKGEALREFMQLIADLDASTDPAQRSRLEQEAWKRFGTRRAVLITDMCGFSRTTRERGICHFLALIEHAKQMVIPIVLRNKGTILKFEVDDAFCVFDSVDDALATARELHVASTDFNRGRDPIDHISLAIGIDSGDLLLIGDCEFYGDPVNTACKLGEDVAAAGETLVTARALAEAQRDRAYVMTRQSAWISGIEIEYGSVQFMHARGTLR